MKNFNNFIKKIKTNISIPADVLEISNAFVKAGKELFLVGGAVRDHLQGKTPHDFDLVTNALPEETKQILKDFDVSDEQGKNFGVLRVFTETEPLGHEIATFRKDISGGRDNKGDDEKVEIGKHISIEDDVLRRDLTINALFFDINKKEIVDLVGGVEDIKNGVIRTVGVAEERFKEDRLRILRVFRFTARTNGKIDKTTEEAIRKDNRLSGISAKEDVSKERIHEEFDKVMDHAKADISIMQRYVDLLTDFDMWKEMFGDLLFNPLLDITTLRKSFIMKDLFDEVELTSKFKKKLIRTFKFKAETVEEMTFLDSLILFTEDDIFDLTRLRERFHISVDFINDAIKHFDLDKDEMKAFIDFSDIGFIVDGNDLMKQGFKGKEIDTEKRRLETERFITEFLNK